MAIRSAKHASSTAYAHALDFERLKDVSSFAPVLKTSTGDVKPVVIITVDGGPDENPRYAKSIEVAIHNFKFNNLDALFLATNAPGRSAFNLVERRMAPLSRQMTGLVLPYDKWGNHLNSKGETIDDELERKNFRHAGETLAEVWSKLVLDKFEVFSEYVDPTRSSLEKEDLITVSEEWKADHVRTTQYFLQVVKCHNVQCCGQFRSKYATFFPGRFLPAPIPVHYNSQIDIVSDPTLVTQDTQFVTLFQNLALFSTGDTPYDAYCPSVSEQLSARTCDECGIYFASQTLLKRHEKIHAKSKPHCKKRPKRIVARRNNEYLVEDESNSWEVEWLDAEDITTEGVPFMPPEDDPELPVIDLNDYFDPIWESA